MTGNIRATAHRVVFLSIVIKIIYRTAMLQKGDKAWKSKAFLQRHFLWLYFIQNNKKYCTKNVYKYEFICVHEQIKRCIYILMKCDTESYRGQMKREEHRMDAATSKCTWSLLHNLKQFFFFFLNKWEHQLRHVYIFFFFNHILHAVTSSLSWICHFFWSIWLPGQTGNCYNSALCSSVFAGKW